MPARFEVFYAPVTHVDHEVEEWRWRLRGANGEIMAQSEGYATKGNARRGAQDVIDAVIGYALDGYSAMVVEEESGPNV